MPYPPRPRFEPRLALSVGLIAAAATSGALLGFGLRAGTPARPFNAIARLLLGAESIAVWGFEPRVTLVGVALHVTLMLGWGVVLSVTGARRGWRLALAAVAVAALAFLVEVLVLPRLLPAGDAELLAPGQLVALHVVLALALALGMRFAFTGRQDAS